MDDYFMTRRHVPAFGSCDSGDYFLFTECFQSARHGGLLRYAYKEEDEDGGVDSVDLYVTGDLYQNDGVTPAMIVVPRGNSECGKFSTDAKKLKKQSGQKARDKTHQPNVEWLTPSPVRLAKPVDEDLYKISPELLHKNATKKMRWGIFASCCLA